MNVALAISPAERRLRDRIDELEEEVRQCRDLLVPAEILPFDWGLEPAQNRLVIALAKAPNGYLTHEQIYRAVSMYSTESTVRAIVGIQIHRARKKLASRQITINTRWGTGYEMPQASRDIIKAAIRFAAREIA